MIDQWTSEEIERFRSDAEPVVTQAMAREQKPKEFEGRPMIRCLGNFAPSIASEALEGSRVSTGPLKIGKDWPGVFIRGDEALAFANIIEKAWYRIDRDSSPLASLIELLRSCRVSEQSSLSQGKRP